MQWSGNMIAMLTLSDFVLGRQQSSAPPYWKAKCHIRRCQIRRTKSIDRSGSCKALLSAGKGEGYNNLFASVMCERACGGA